MWAQIKENKEINLGKQTVINFLLEMVNVTQQEKRLFIVFVLDLQGYGALFFKKIERPLLCGYIAKRTSR